MKRRIIIDIEKCEEPPHRVTSFMDIIVNHEEPGSVYAPADAQPGTVLRYVTVALGLGEPTEADDDLLRRLVALRG